MLKQRRMYADQVAASLFEAEQAIDAARRLQVDWDKPPAAAILAAVAMAALPPYANMLESIVLPVDQPYIGRG